MIARFGEPLYNKNKSHTPKKVILFFKYLPLNLRKGVGRDICEKNVFTSFMDILSLIMWVN